MSKRPQLPLEHANPLLKGLTKSSVPPVKYQVLNCQGAEILVGRLKISTPTPSGHAFILRRFDTNAVSLTTMFRAAFPAASEADEKREVSWVKSAYDLAGNNGGSNSDPSIPRLAGTWVSTDVALELGGMYSLGGIMNMVVTAEPDPGANYKRPTKASTTTAAARETQKTASMAVVEASTTPSKTTRQSSPSVTAPPPTKRRKESSPAPASPATRVVSPPPSRRSIRGKSPAPKTVPVPPITPRSPRNTRGTRKEAVFGSDDTTAVDEDEHASLSVAGKELYEQDIAEQKAMIADLKAARDAAASKMTVDSEAVSTSKRAREDEDKPLQFEFKEPEVEERQIATNRKVSTLSLQPRTKSVVWGAAAFAFGLGLVSFMPNFL